MGIVGDNGAGKSTLLKLITGTVSPSSGKIEVGGTIAALLELGAGFHPEFSGRQNIHLACSLLDIAADHSLESEIISFSGLGEFIDRPVKTYSSGMYVRLGFAIATSVDPDILIIDEALAVGDIKFQRRCIERMGAFRDEGKTMVFCSHSMYHIQEICNKVLWLDKGEVQRIGPVADVLAEYEDFCRAKRSMKPEKIQLKNEIMHQLAQTKDCYINSVSLETPDGTPLNRIRPFSTVVMRMEVDIHQDGLKPQFGFALLLSDDSIFSASLTHHDRFPCGPYQEGQRVVVRLVIDEIPIKSGKYRLTGGVADERGLLWYDMKDFGPILVDDEESGVGLVCFKQKWDIASSN